MMSTENTPTPRTDSYWNSYRSGAITAAEFKEAVCTLERELNEQCVLNGKGSEREYVLLGKLTRAEAELVIELGRATHYRDEWQKKCAENAALRAQVAQLEKTCTDIYDAGRKAEERLERDNAALRAELADIGRYTGEGGPNTPWQSIVRDLGAQARAALAKEGGK